MDPRDLLREHKFEDELKGLSGEAFEIFVYRLLLPLTEEGWEVHLTARNNDYGGDLLLVLPDGDKCVVQCKYSQDLEAPCNNTGVQEVVAARTMYQAAYALMVTSATRFTPNAMALAEANLVRLCTRDDLESISQADSDGIADILELEELCFSRSRRVSADRRNSDYSATADVLRAEALREAMRPAPLEWPLVPPLAAARNRPPQAPQTIRIIERPVHVTRRSGGCLGFFVGAAVVVCSPKSGPPKIECSPVRQGLLTAKGRPPIMENNHEKVPFYREANPRRVSGS